MYTEWFSEVHRAAKSDNRYEEALAQLLALEPGFLKIRDALPPGDREHLDRYIAACEALDDALLAVAYRVRP